MNTIELDLRGLPPPEPMVRVLQAIPDLAPVATLLARTDRRPMHLLLQLESRGFSAEYEEQPDGSFLTLIRHA